MVGGMWDEIGRLQFEFLRARGLKADHWLLDIGCGCLRGGIHAIKYLKTGNYYGFCIILIARLSKQAATNLVSRAWTTKTLIWSLAIVSS